MKSKPLISALIAISMIFSGCNYILDGSASILKDMIDSSEMYRVDFPARNSGFSNLQNKVIRSEAELNEYIQFINGHQRWFNKTDFINALLGENKNFDTMNLLIYTHTEPSGSIGVMLSHSVREDENIVIYIARNVPQSGTGDMAYYAYAFKVKKTIPKVIFDLGDRRIEISN
ncbi:hypothetical protein ACFL5P_02295 [candidate division KSB1 bacterium]